MTDKLLIERELLERAADMLTIGQSADSIQGELRAILASPRQPKGDELEVVACMWTHENGLQLPSVMDRSPFYEGKGTFHGEPLCRLSDAQGAIAELREELQQAYRQVNSECMDWAKEYERRKEVQAERDTLRQQLAEAKGSADLWYQTASEQIAKADGLTAQRDKLAGLLREAHSAGRSRRLTVDELYRIDAALAEVEP